MTRAALEAWLQSHDWPAIYAAAQRDICEAITKLRQERVVCREWLLETLV